MCFKKKKYYALENFKRAFIGIMQNNNNKVLTVKYVKYNILVSLYNRNDLNRGHFLTDFQKTYSNEFICICI